MLRDGRPSRHTLLRVLDAPVKARLQRLAARTFSRYSAFSASRFLCHALRENIDLLVEEKDQSGASARVFDPPHPEGEHAGKFTQPAQAWLRCERLEG